MGVNSVTEGLGYVPSQASDDRADVGDSPAGIRRPFTLTMDGTWNAMTLRGVVEGQGQAQ